MSDNTDGSGKGDNQPQQTREEFDAKAYPDNVKHVGRALLVNNIKFQGKAGTSKCVREGSQRDEEAIYALLLKLGFTDQNITRGTNQTKTQLKDLIQKAANKDYSDFGCFLCVIMSFGEPGIIICPGDKADERCELKDIQAPFTGDKCKSLATKPKIYFIMGNSNYQETDVSEGGKTSKPPVVLQTRKIPRECNFVTQYSSDTDQGQWGSKKTSPYITAVINAFETHVVKGTENMDILKLLTRINGRMAVEEATIPLVTSLLTKRYHFKPQK